MFSIWTRSLSCGPAGAVDVSHFALPMALRTKSTPASVVGFMLLEDPSTAWRGSKYSAIGNIDSFRNQFNSYLKKNTRFTC